MKPIAQRAWITPLVIGAFSLSAVTGVLMFFHLETPANKGLHEWFSWALLVGGGLHVLKNQAAFMRYLRERKAQAVIAVFAVFLALSFVPWSPKEQPASARPLQALARAPLSVLAQVAGTEVGELQARLKAQGVDAAGPTQSVQDLVGPDRRRQTQLLDKLLAPAGAPAVSP